MMGRGECMDRESKGEERAEQRGDVRLISTIIMVILVATRE